MAAMIRAVAPRDASAWASMRSCLWPDADPAELAREASAFLDGVPSATVHAVFVASEDEVPPVGFIELAVRAFSEGCVSSPVPHVEGWYVQPSARGRGIGRRLIEAAEAWSRALGFSELASDTEIHNTASLSAHEACGFAEIERLIV
jgi:aminoglycoside 6'-N-acetyltransferase I